MKKAFGYLRVSTEEQTKGYSLEAQKRAIEEYCKNNNIKIIKFFEDHTSGAKIQRRELQSMLDELDLVDAVIVWKIDRLSRSVKDTLKIMEIFEEKNKELISITEPFLSIRGNSQSKLMMHIFSSFAQYERDLIRERMMVGKIQKAKKGLIPSGKAPYGYRYRNHTYEIIEEEAKVVKLIFEKYLQYKSISLVVKYLNENGYLGRNNKKWIHSTVNKILRNPIYKGIYIYNRRTSIKGKRWIKPEEEWIIIEKKELQIVDEVIFEKAQEILNINSTVKKSSNRLGTGVSLFGGLIKCGVCGKNFVIKSSKRRTPYYRCKSYDEVIPCGNDYAYEPFIEKGVVKIIERLVNVSKNEIYEHILKEIENKDFQKKLQKIEEEINQTKIIINRFVNEFEKFLIEGREIPKSLKDKLNLYEEKLKQLENKKHNLMFQIQKYENEIISWDEFLEYLKKIKEILSIATREDKKLLYKAVFDEIVFDRGKVKAYIKGKEFELEYRPRIINLSEEDIKLLEEINTIRSKIVLMANQTADKNEIAKVLGVDQYLIDYCIDCFKKGMISILKIDKPNKHQKSKFFYDVKRYIEEKNIDINSVSSRSLYKEFIKDTKIDIKEATFRKILYKLGKKRIRKF